MYLTGFPTGFENTGAALQNLMEGRGWGGRGGARGSLKSIHGGSMGGNKCC